MAADRVLERINLDLYRADDFAIPGRIVLRVFEAIAQPPHAIQVRA